MFLNLFYFSKVELQKNIMFFMVLGNLGQRIIHIHVHTKEQLAILF